MTGTSFIVNVEGAIYDQNQNKWLLVRRSEKEEHAKGVLSLVGGKAESLESPNILEETLKREIQEETGILVRDEMRYVESKSFSVGADRLVLDVVFLCFYKEGTARAMDPDELTEALWLGADDITADSAIPSWTKESIAKAQHALGA